MDLVNYGLHQKYEQLGKIGNSLSGMKNVIDWESLRPMVSDLYRNDTEKGGSPNFDPVFKMKALILQSVYNLADEAMEKEMYNRIDFMKLPF